MFDGSFIEGKSNELNIIDFDAVTVGNMLNFIYNEKLEETYITTELLLAADKYQVSSLVKECEKEFVDKLSIENAAKIWLTLHTVGTGLAKNRVMAFIANFWPAIQETECCKNITNQDSKLPLELLSYLYGKRKTLQYADNLQADIKLEDPIVR